MPPNAAELLQAQAALQRTETTVTQVDGKKYIEQTGACIESNSDGYVVDYKPSPEICPVIEGSLYFGSQDAAENVDGFQCPGGEKFPGLRELGISHIISACGGQEQVPGIQYLHLPLLDLPDQQLLDAAERSNAFIQSAIDSGGRCLVHCNAGISRSASLVIAYLLSRGLAADYDSALEAVRKNRPSAKPNQGFEAQLRAMAAKQGVPKTEPCARNEGWLALPAPEDSSASINLDVSTGEAVTLDHLGPVVVNADGTLARIANWEGMSDRERELTRQRIAKRNLERLAHFKESEQLGEHLVRALRPG